MNDFKLVTVSTGRPSQNYYTYDQFFKSIGDIEPLVLGTNFSPYYGLCSKVKMVYMAIKEGLIKTKYILFCDCWDTFFAVSPEQLIQCYKTEFNYYPLIFSSERNCFPNTMKDEYDKLFYTSSYRYLNSGMIVGETEALLALIESFIFTEDIFDDYHDAIKKCNIHCNDQEIYLKHFLKQVVPMTLDYDQQLCQTLHQTTPEDFYIGANVMNKETGSFPCMFHANGSSKDSGVKEPILKHLNLL